MRRGKFRLAVPALGVLIAAGPGTGGVGKSAQAAEFRLDPPSSEVPAGGSTNVTLQLDNATSVYGAAVGIGFDPAVLSVVGDSVTPGTCPQPDFVVTNRVIGNVVDYAATQLSPRPPCNGGLLATVGFRCAGGLAANQSVPVRIDTSLLSNPDGEAIPHTTQDAVIHCRVGCTGADCALLTVAKTGTGSGTVTSDPAGIDCGSDCSQSYDTGTQVELSAERDQGSTFEGWDGDCAGTMPTVQVSMDADQTCNADFTPCVAVKDLSGQNVADAQHFEACTGLQAGYFLIMGGGGDVTFKAGEQIILDSGFEVETGGVFAAEIDPALSP